jgi:chromosome partitioning protein
MIITIGGIKGGSGKSTVATTIAVLLSARGRDILLVDADDQGTATDFTAFRESTLGQSGYTAIQLSGAAVRTEIQKMRSRYQDIIIDTGGRDTSSQRAAIVISDLYIIPFIPRSFDLWTLDSVVKLIGEMQPANPNLQSFALINKSDHQGRDNDEAKIIIAEADGIEYLDVPLGHRKSFANAAASGLAVTETKTRDERAINEANRLVDAILALESK